MVAAQNAYLGPAAGVATSLLWSMTSLCFTAASRRLGAATVNTARIGLATLWLGLTHRLLTGRWVPAASSKEVLLLALSGLVGLTIGDLALFASFVQIGPRLAMLIMTVAPIFAALFGWIALGEAMGVTAWLGMALTLGGVAWVVMERPAQASLAAKSDRIRGLTLAFVGAICQAVGSLLSKTGMGHGWLPDDQLLSPQTASFLRMFFAGAFSLPTIFWLAARNRTTAPPAATRRGRNSRRTAYFFTLAGSVVGPYLGMWMSLEAFHRCSLGVGQTLCSLTPVFILPFVILIQKERVSGRAALGAFVAVAGTAVLFLPHAAG